MSNNADTKFVADVRERMASDYHGIHHNGNDHAQGRLANCPRCIAEGLLAALAALEAELAHINLKAEAWEKGSNSYADAWRKAEVELARKDEALRRGENDWVFLFNLNVDLKSEVRQALAKANLDVIRAALAEPTGEPDA